MMERNIFHLASVGKLIFSTIFHRTRRQSQNRPVSLDLFYTEVKGDSSLKSYIFSLWRLKPGFKDFLKRICGQ